MPKSMILPLVVLLCVLGAATYVQGVVSERWGIATSERLKELAENVDSNIQAKMGEWDGTFKEMDEQQFKASNCAAGKSCLYRNLRTGEDVEAYIVVGTARNVTIHTPEQCYVGAGYELEGEMQSYSLECAGVKNPVEFRTATFRRDAADGITRLRVFWTFSDDGTWLGPRQHKVAFAGKKQLAKIYLITQIPLGVDDIDNSPSLVFAEDNMALINDALFDGQGNLPAEERAKLSGGRSRSEKSAAATDAAAPAGDEAKSDAAGTEVEAESTEVSAESSSAAP